MKCVENPYKYEVSPEDPKKSVKQLKTLMLLATVFKSDRAIELSTLEHLELEENEEESDGQASTNDGPEDFDDHHDYEGYLKEMNRVNGGIEALGAVRRQDADLSHDLSARGEASVGSSLIASEEASGEVGEDTAPAVRRSSRLAEKRRASEEMEGDPKRRKDSSWIDIEVEELDTDAD
jgi:hypothetical protein